MSDLVLAGADRASFRLTAVIVASALFMEHLDGTVLATALPAMARSFGVDPLHLNVALTAYLLSLAVFIPASGRIADRYGSRTVFRGAILIFTVGSMLCGQAHGVTELVASRVLQGMGGAMMAPVGRLVVLRSVAKKDLVNAMTWVLIPALLGPIIGPPLGGFFVTYLSWRWIFYINVPIGVLGMVLATLFIDEVREPVRKPLDLIGLMLSGTSLACLIFGFELAARGASGLLVALGLFVVGVASGAMYLRHARRVVHPILDFRLMQHPTFALSVIGGACSRIAAGSMPFLLPMMLQLGFGFSALRSGLITFMPAMGAMAMKVAATPILRRFGFRNALMWNGVFSTLVMMSCAAFRPGWPLLAIYAVLLAAGFAQSLQFTALNAMAYADISRTQMSEATSFYTTFQQLMLSAGICTAALALAVSKAVLHHADATMTDFSVAFVTVGMVTLASAPICALLPVGAGDEMAGR